MRLYHLFNAFLVLAGCFLPWIHPGLFVPGLRGVEMFDGKVALSLALIGFGTASFQLIQKKEGLDWLFGGIGLAIGVIAGMDLYIFYRNRYSIGPGLYLTALGGLQLTGSYVLILYRRMGRREGGGQKKNGDLPS